MRDDPNNPEGVALHVRALAKMGQFDRAVQSGRGYLATNPRDDRAAATVRLAVARALLEANRNLDAAREYEIVLSQAGRPGAGGVLRPGPGRREARQRRAGPRRSSATLCGPAAGDVRTRLLLADYYSQDFEDQKVIEIINSFAGLRQQQPGPPDPAGGRPAAGVAVVGRPGRGVRHAPGRSSASRRRTSAATWPWPGRSRWRRTTARRAVQYDQLIAIDPDFTIPPRERARILFSDHQYSAARTQYNVMLSPTPEEMVLGQMAYHAQRDARVRQAFAPYLGGHMNGPAVRAELARLAATCAGRGGPPRPLTGSSATTTRHWPGRRRSGWSATARS